MPPSFVVVVLHECDRKIYDRVIETLILISYMFGSVREGFLKGGTEMFQDNLKTLIVCCSYLLNHHRRELPDRSRRTR